MPFGYRLGEDGVLVEQPEEQAVIARVRALRRSGAPLRKIQAEIAAEHARRLSLDALARICRE